MRGANAPEDTEEIGSSWRLTEHPGRRQALTVWAKTKGGWDVLMFCERREQAVACIKEEARRLGELL
jgi:hypothetical protein